MNMTTIYVTDYQALYPFSYDWGISYNLLDILKIDFFEQKGSGDDIHLDTRPSESLVTKVESHQ